MPSEPIEIAKKALGLGRDGKAVVPDLPAGPPPRIDGYTIGVARMTHSPPTHGGEVHPDGDEILYLISGEAEITLEETDERKIVIKAGQAFVVPQGIWHRVRCNKPEDLLHITPGPGGSHRPAQRD